MTIEENVRSILLKSKASNDNGASRLRVSPGDVMTLRSKLDDGRRHGAAVAEKK